MPVLKIPQKNARPLIIDFDPDKETQGEIEKKYNVSFSEYFETREKAAREMDGSKAGWSFGQKTRGVEAAGV